MVVPSATSRVLYVVATALVVVFTSGGSMLAPQAMRRLLSLRDSPFPEDNGMLKDFNDYRLVRIVNLGVAFQIFGYLPTGVLCNKFGPRVCSVVGQLLCIVGYLVLFFTDSNSEFCGSIGIASLGVAAPMIFVSLVNIVGEYSPGSLVIGLLGGTVNLGAYVPLVLYKISQNVATTDAGQASRQVQGLRHVVGYYVAMVACVCILEGYVVFVIAKHEMEEDTTLDTSCEEPLTDGHVTWHLEPTTELDVALETRVCHTSVPSDTAMSVAPVLKSCRFWMLALFTAWMFFCNIHYASTIAAVLNQIASTSDKQPHPSLEGTRDGGLVMAPFPSEVSIPLGGTRSPQVGWYVDLFDSLIPLAFLPCLLKSAMMEKTGAIAMMFLIAMESTGMLAVCMIRSLAVQLFGFVLFVSFSSFQIVFAFSSLVAFYGYGRLNILQGILLSVAALACLSQPSWDSFIGRRLAGDLVRVNGVLSGVSVMSMLLPACMLCCPSAPQGAREELPLLVAEDVNARCVVEQPRFFGKEQVSSPSTAEGSNTCYTEESDKLSVSCSSNALRKDCTDVV